MFEDDNRLICLQTIAATFASVTDSDAALEDTKPRDLQGGQEIRSTND